eukprot:m.849251 g.849251  ORF g.849251 m.849251 type:complete len:322 (+) comp23490_c2_seq37:183-1148(+)
MWFTRKDVETQLLALGYENVPDEVLDNFVADLFELAQHEEAQQHQLGVQIGGASDTTSVSSMSSSRTFTATLTQHNIASNGRHHRSSAAVGSKDPGPSRRICAQNASISTDTSSSEGDYKHHGVRRVAVNQDSSRRQAWTSASGRLKHRQKDPTHSSSLRVLEDIDGNIGRRSRNGRRDVVDSHIPSQQHSDDNFDQQQRDVDESTIVLSSDDDDDDDDESTAMQDAPSSFIRARVPMRIVKHDPVSRGRQYREAQSKFRIPGQDRHERVRRETHERMQRDKEEPFVRPRHMYRKNAYVVPTEKKRLPLRWAVRQYTEHAQ